MATAIRVRFIDVEWKRGREGEEERDGNDGRSARRRGNSGFHTCFQTAAAPEWTNGQSNGIEAKGLSYKEETDDGAR